MDGESVLVFVRRVFSTIRYFLSYPAEVKPFLPPETLVQPPSAYAGPTNLYGKARGWLRRLGILQLARRLLGIRFVMTLRYFFSYSPATPSDAHFRYTVTPYQLASPNVQGGDQTPAVGVNLVGYFRSDKGLGQAARNILRCSGQVSFPMAAFSIDERDAAHVLVTPPANMEPIYDINLICANADQTFQIEHLLGKPFYRERYNIGYWFWELEHFPPQWAGAFAQYDEIWVASRFVQQAIRLNTSKPVSLIPVAIEVDDSPAHRRTDLGLPEDAYVVLYMFDTLGTFARKNPCGVIEAFKQAFSETEREHDVRLVIKGINLADAPAETAEMRQRLHEVNGILIEQQLSREETNALIHHCDAYLSLHRSEGFGLTMAEAMYLGKPVIATAYSGNMDFMTEENSYLVPYQPVTLQQHHGLYEQDNQWADPDIHAAAELLRAVYANPEQAKSTGRRAAQHIRDHYSTAVIGQKISERIAAIQSSRVALPDAQRKTREA